MKPSIRLILSFAAAASGPIGLSTAASAQDIVFPSLTASPKSDQKKVDAPVAPVAATKTLAAPAQSAKSAPLPPPPAPTATPLPKNLEGVVTQEEFAKYAAYQAKIRNNAEIKELNDKIMALVQEIQPLQAQLDALRSKAMNSNAEMKAIGDKIMKHAGTKMPPLAKR